MRMRRHLRPLVVLAAALVLSARWMAAAAAQNAAPEVALTAGDGSTVHLSDYRGKVVLVDFWASWCVSCKRSFPALDGIYRDYEPRGFEVLAVNLDEKRRDAETFLDKYPHRLTVVFDPAGRSALQFGVKGMPTSFLIDRAGVIRFTHVGYAGDVAAAYRREIAQLLGEH